LPYEAPKALEMQYKMKTATRPQKILAIMMGITVAIVIALHYMQQQ